MSLPLICELGINTFDRARCNSKQRLQQPSLQPQQNRKQPSVLLKEESGSSDRIARELAYRAGSRPHNTKHL